MWMCMNDSNYLSKILCKWAYIKGLILCPLASWQKPGEIFKQERARVTFVFTKALSRVHMEVSVQGVRVNLADRWRKACWTGVWRALWPEL